MTEVVHVVALSGGKDSTAMACRLRELHPDRDFVWLCTPTGDELPEMFAHWNGLGRHLGKRLLPIMAHTGLTGMMAEEGMIPNRLARYCTRKLKIYPYRKWLKEQAAVHGTVISYVGLRADEEGRAGGAYEDIEGVVNTFPLREWGWGVNDVWSYLERTPGHTKATMAADIPERTDCARCYHQSLGEWWRLWRDFPDTYQECVDQETQFGHTFRTPRLAEDGTPIMATKLGFTFASSWRDTWPCRLADMREIFEAGHVPPRTKQQHDLFRGAGECRVCTL